MSVTKVIKLVVDVDSTDIQNVDNQIDKVTGGAVTKFRGLTKGIKSAVAGFKSLRVAIISTGIGALLIAITSLVSFFTKTQKGADLLSQAMAAIGTVVNVLVDRISLLGGALVKLFKGDFKGAFEDVGNAVSGVTDEIIRETKAIIALEKEMQNLRDAEIDLIVTNAERQKEIEKNRLLAEDETLAIEKRIEALDRATQIEKEVLADELEIARRRAEAIAAEVELSESTAEDIEKREQARAKVIQLETASLRFEKRIITRRNALVKEGEAERNRILKEAQKAREEADKKTLKDRKVDTVRSKKFTAKDFTELEGFAKLEIEKTNIVAENEQLRNAIRQEAADEELRIRQILSEQELALIATTAGRAAQILGENTAAGKAFAVAQALINTYQGITNVWSEKSESGLVGAGLVQRIATTAIVAAQGFAAVKDILSVKVPGGFSGGAGGNTTGSRGGAPAFNVVGTSGVNQLAESLQQDQQPVQAFVVGSNVTSQQALDRNITETATLG